MVRKRKKREDEQPPWCYYCDRVFSDEPTLVQHQKAKHFKCTVCHKRLTSAGGLRVHCHQVHRFALEKVPFAKPGKESLDVEVFGMAGVPEGATPGAPPPEEDEPPAQSISVVPAPLPPPGSQMPGTLAPGMLMQSQPHYIPPTMQPINIQQPMPGAPPFAPPAFSGMPPPFILPPPGMAPPPGFQMRGMLPQGGPVMKFLSTHGPGPFQQQRPPLFPGGAGPPAQGQPPSHATQGPGPAAAPNMGSEAASMPRPLFPVGQIAASGAVPAQGRVSNASANVQPALQPELQRVFPIGQGTAVGVQPAPGSVHSTEYSARPALQPHSVFPAEQPAAASGPLAPGLATGPPLGHGTSNGSVHTTPAQYDAPALDESNPAVIWKAIHMSMEESRAQQPRYQQKLSKAAEHMLR